MKQINNLPNQEFKALLIRMLTKLEKTIYKHMCPSHSNKIKKKKRHPYWKRISKTGTICTWYDTIHRKP